MRVVELSDVGKRYPGNPPVDSLAGVDLKVESGELVAVVGPSGSGKSTLLTVMGTLERPSHGEVRITGVETSKMADAELSGLRAWRIGFVFQAFHLLEGVTALENVASGLIYRGLPARKRRELAREALDRVGMSHRGGHVPSRLSGGERQRVAIARALAGRPSILFADEPTGNLDTASGAAIIDLLLDLNGDGATIVVVSHNEAVVERFPRRILLRDGRVVADS
jgi:putative ABC transport system ATP-binding protein